MSHGSAQDFLRRFWIVTVLLIPLALSNEMLTTALGIGVLPLGKWISFGIATVIFGFALVFFEHAGHEIRARKYGMMTLVSLAVGSGYLFSVASTFVGAIEVEFYLEIATLIWVLLFGHYLEARSSSAAGDALTEVAKLLPKQAHLLSGGQETDVDVGALKVGDVVLVKPGEKMPADGTIEQGTAHVDESLISGESVPIAKRAGDAVVAGSVCTDGSLTVVLTRVGAHSTIGQIHALIARAQETKPRSQRIADRAASILTVVAGLTAIGALLIWTLVVGASFVSAATLAITVLVIACPHALGLAIPTVTTITTSLAVRNGIFIKNLGKIEVLKRVGYVVFDKTGTLTAGEFGVTDIVGFGYPEEEVLRIAASLEQHSSHIIGLSIVRAARERGIALSTPEAFENIAGKGVRGRVGETEYVLGNRALAGEHLAASAEASAAFVRLSAEGKTSIIIASGHTMVGLLALADEVRPESFAAVRALHAMGVKVAMLTGDSEPVAERVARTLGIDTYFAEVLPEDKYAHIRSLQAAGHVVVMVGDGVNDAPALAQADAGVAIGAGTDVAVEAGDVVLMRNSPLDVVRLIVLARRVYTKMIQNLVWALGYNIIAIPAAAGAFAAWGFFLRPEIGALLMSLSTVIVVANAMTLKRLNLERV